MNGKNQGRKAPTMIEAYDTLMKVTDGKIRLFEAYEIQYVQDICRGIYCDKEKCRKACGELRSIRLQKRKQ